METQTEIVPQKQAGKKLQRFFLNFGKLALDVTKLIFASLVLGTVIRGDIPPTTLLVVGIIASSAGAIFGLIAVTLCEEK
jgi:hypothetical protein